MSTSASATAPSDRALPARLAHRPGLLVVNLGTPDSAQPPDVRRYLRQFLSDPRVLDVHPVGRWLLLNLIILPFRPRKSAHAYQKIWTPDGSPLLVHGRSFAAELTNAFAGRMPVELAMRYGNPSIASALARLRQQQIDELVVFPLYPQAAASTTSSTLAEVYRQLESTWDVMPVRVVPPFFDDEGFLGAFAQVARAQLAGRAVDHVLFSFHGIPVRHLTKSDPSGSHCQASAGCCDALTSVNRGCYRAQCFSVARSLAQRLNLSADGYTVCFQSRLGRVEWARPYTDEVLTALARKGVKKVAVVCPAFVADCLETLEEIALREAERFKAEGGEELLLVRSLNADEAWVRAATALVERATGFPARP